MLGVSVFCFIGMVLALLIQFWLWALALTLALCASAHMGSVR